MVVDGLARLAFGTGYHLTPSGYRAGVVSLRARSKTRKPFDAEKASAEKVWKRARGHFLHVGPLEQTGNSKFSFKLTGTKKLKEGANIEEVFNHDFEYWAQYLCAPFKKNIKNPSFEINRIGDPSETEEFGGKSWEGISLIAVDYEVTISFEVKLPQAPDVDWRPMETIPEDHYAR